MKWFRQNTPLSQHQQKKWWEAEKNNPLHYHFIAASGEIRLGYCALRIDSRHSKAEFSIFSSKKLGKGPRILGELLHFGFNDLNLHRIYSDVLDGNPALRLFKAFGFRVEGVNREAYWKDGRWVHSTNIGLLKEEYGQTTLARRVWVNSKEA